MPSAPAGDAPTSASLVQELPWLGEYYGENSAYAYLLTILSFVAIWAVLHGGRWLLVQRLARRARSGTALAFFGSLVQRLNPWILPLVALYVAVQRLHLPQVLEKGLKYLTIALVTIQVARILGELAGFLITRARAYGRKADDPVARNVNENLTVLAKFAVWTGAILFILDNFGFNVTTFIAGLGIGGVAIALAAQAILGDTFSSFAIALDKPFEVGDFIAVGDMMGTVEHIGLKTTRVRSVGGELLIFANSDLTKSRIKNFKKMAERHVVFRIGVTRQLPREKLGRVAEILREAVTQQPGTRLDRAHFTAFNDATLQFEVAYYVERPNANKHLDIQQAINFYIFDRLAAEGISLTFPV